MFKSDSLIRFWNTSRFETTRSCSLDLDPDTRQRRGRSTKIFGHFWTRKIYFENLADNSCTISPWDKFLIIPSSVTFAWQLITRTVDTGNPDDQRPLDGVAIMNNEVTAMNRHTRSKILSPTRGIQVDSLNESTGNLDLKHKGPNNQELSRPLNDPFPWHEWHNFLQHARSFFSTKKSSLYKRLNARSFFLTRVSSLYKRSGKQFMRPHLGTDGTISRDARKVAS